jgi:hypothetical protein
MNLPKFVLLLILCVVQALAGNPHKKINYPCQECHTEADWKIVHFAHQKTDFDLEGVHKTLTCKACHKIEDFSLVSSDCQSCHQDVHQGKLGADCKRCHQFSSWIQLDIQKVHANTSFPFIGIHASLDCKICHSGEIEGEYKMLKSFCIDCHQNKYEQTTNPIHSSLGFSHQCQECHTLFSWQPADFKQHDAYFPIYSGAHNGKWDNCQTCHYVEGNYQQFSCFLNCHEHNQASTDGKHKEVSGYIYDSQACYNCHRGGKGDD